MVTVLQTTEFAKRLKDAEAQARILVRMRRLSLTNNFGDVKPVGDGVYKMHIAGYRPYHAKWDSALVLLLIGGDESSQQRGITKTKKLNLEYR